MVENLLNVLREEVDLLGMLLSLAHEEAHATRHSDIEGLRTATEEKARLVERIQDVELRRQGAVAGLSGTIGRPAEDLSLREIAQSVEGPYATQLQELRSQLSSLAASISELSEQNKASIAHRLRLDRSFFSFVDKETASGSVYHPTGEMTDRSGRTGRVLSGEF
jgi:flagellar biosynthesis/type III secretory pathway chaperone